MPKRKTAMEPIPNEATLWDSAISDGIGALQALFQGAHPPDVVAFLQFLRTRRISIPKLFSVLDVILCMGQDKQSTLENVKTLLGGSTMCSRPFDDGSVVFVCRTCQADSTCAICVDCFDAADHEGHNYAAMTVSGGCCDCGDPQSWYTPCRKHAEIHSSASCDTLGAALANEEVSAFFRRLISLTSFAITKTVASVIALGSDTSQAIRKTMRLISCFVDWITGLCSCGPAFLRALSLSLTVQQQGSGETPIAYFLGLLADSDQVHLGPPLTRLVVSLLSDLEFRVPFLSALLPVYGALRDNRCSLLDSITVQLFCTSALVDDFISLDAVGELLRVLFNALRQCSMPHPPQGSVHERRFTINTEVHDTKYSEIAVDIKYLLKHDKLLATSLLNMPTLECLVSILSMLQGMGPLRRKTGAHIEFENQDWIYAFELEIELNEIVDFFVKGFRSRHPNSPETTDILKALLAELVHHLYRYFEDDDGSVIQTGPMSFHIPLHRMFARIFSVYLGTATAQKDTIRQALAEIIPNGCSVDDFLWKFSTSIIRIQATLAEINAGYWRKNGEVSAQANGIYRGPNFSTMAMLPDLLGMQLVAAGIDDAGGWLDHIARHFGLNMDYSERGLDSKMAEEFLRLVIAISRDISAGDPHSTSYLRSELIAHLSSSELGLMHSELCSRLAQVHVEHNELESLLAEVSVWRPPHGTSSGRYVLEPKLFTNNFDPYFFPIIQTEIAYAESRFHEACRLADARSQKPVCIPLPDKSSNVNSLLHSPVLHRLLGDVFNYALDNSTPSSERLMRSVLYILTLDASREHELVAPPMKRRRTSSSTGLSAEHRQGPSFLQHAPLLTVLGRAKRHNAVMSNPEFKHSVARLGALICPFLSDADAACGIMPQQRTSGSQSSRKDLARARQAALLDSFSRRRHAFEVVADETEPASDLRPDEMDNPQCMLCCESHSARQPVGIVSYVTPCQVVRSTHRRAASNAAAYTGNASVLTQAASSSSSESIRSQRSSSERNFPIHVGGFLDIMIDGQRAVLPDGEASLEAVLLRQLLSSITPQRAAVQRLNTIEEEIGDLFLAIFRRWAMGAGGRLPDVSLFGQALNQVASVDFDWRNDRNSMFVQSCGHHVCRPCHRNYMSSRTSVLPSLESRSFHCPVCRRLSNVLLPLPRASFPSSSAGCASRDMIQWLNSCIHSDTMFSCGSHVVNVTRADYAAAKGLLDGLLKCCDAVAPHASTAPSVIFMSVLGSVIETIDVALESSGQSQNSRQQILTLQLLFHWTRVCLLAENPTSSGISSRRSRRPASQSSQTDGRHRDSIWRKCFGANSTLLQSNLFGSCVQLIPCYVNCPSTMQHVVDIMQLAQLVQAMQSACRSVCADATLARIRKATLCVSGCRTVEDLLVLVWASCLPDTKIELDGLESAAKLAKFKASVSSKCDVDALLAEAVSLCRRFVHKVTMLARASGHDVALFLDASDQGAGLSGAVHRLLSLSPVHTLVFNWIGATSKPCARPTQTRRTTRSQTAAALSRQNSVGSSTLRPSLSQVSKQQADYGESMRRPPFSLVELPRRFHELILQYRGRHCALCTCRRPEQLCVCLLCGSPVCWGNSQQCALRHASQSCDGMDSIFLLLRGSVAVVVHDSMTATWGSLYLDAHGEEDRELARGRPLFLQSDRVDALVSLYVNVGIADFVAQSHREAAAMPGIMMFPPPPWPQ